MPATDDIYGEDLGLNNSDYPCNSSVIPQDTYRINNASTYNPNTPIASNIQHMSAASPQYIDKKIKCENLVIYDRNNKTMYVCRAEYTTEGVIPSMSTVLLLKNAQKSKLQKLAIGCAEFVELVYHTERPKEPVFCKIRISSAKFNGDIKLPCNDIYGKTKALILIYNLRVDIFAETPHLSLRQRSLAYIQYACVAFPCDRRGLSAKMSTLRS